MWFEGSASPSRDKPLTWDVTYRDGSSALELNHLVSFPPACESKESAVATCESKDKVLSLPVAETTCPDPNLSTATVIWEPWMDEKPNTSPVCRSADARDIIAPFPYTPIERATVPVGSQDFATPEPPASIPPFPYTPIDPVLIPTQMICATEDDAKLLSLPPFPYTPITCVAGVTRSSPPPLLLTSPVRAQVSSPSCAESIVISFRSFYNGLPLYTVSRTAHGDSGVLRLY